MRSEIVSTLESIFNQKLAALQNNAEIRKIAFLPELIEVLLQNNDSHKTIARLLEQVRMKLSLKERQKEPLSEKEKEFSLKMTQLVNNYLNEPDAEESFRI